MSERKHIVSACELDIYLESPNQVVMRMHHATDPTVFCLILFCYHLQKGFKLASIVPSRLRTYQLCERQEML